MNHDGNPLLTATIAGLGMVQNAIDDTVKRETVCPPDATKKRPRAVQDLDDDFSLTPPQHLTAGQISNYLQHGGMHCPDCLSHDISGSQFDVDASCCWQNVVCKNCGATWTDEYELTTVTHFVAGTKPKGGDAIDPNTT